MSPLANTTQEVAVALGKSTSRVRQLVAAGVLPAVRLAPNGALRILLGDLCRHATNGREQLLHAWPGRQSIAVREVAQALRVNVRSLYRAAHDAGLPVVNGRIGREALLAWLLARRGAAA